MQITETSSDGLKRELKVVIGAKELDDKLSSRLNELKDQVQLKGFRPGKVPVAHIRKVYGRSIMAEVVQQTVVETSQKALSDRSERPAFEPKIELTEDKDEIEQVMDGKADLAYTMSFEVIPAFDLSDLSKIKLEKETADVEDKAVDEALDRMAENGVTYETKDGPGEDGDRLTLDFVGRIDGEAFEGGTAEGASLVLGSGSFIEGFEAGLIGAKAGDERVINVTFPEDYQAKDLAGKPAEFTVKVNEVAKPIKPEVNDEFAVSMGMTDLTTLKDAIRSQIKTEYEKAGRQKLKRALLDALDEAHDFDLPPTLVEQEFESIWGQVNERLKQAGKTFEDEDTTEDKAREDYQKASKRRVRLGLIISEIGEKNEIKISDEEVHKAIMERARQFPGQEKMLFDFYAKNPQAQAELRAPLYEDKVVDFLLELVKLEEKKVTAEELYKMPDEEESGDDES